MPEQMLKSEDIDGSAKSRLRLIVWSIAVLILLIAMAVDTKIVQMGSDEDIKLAVFSPEAFGKSEFPKVQAAVEKRAADGKLVAAAIEKDKEAAGKEYGVPAGIGPVMSVKFTGIVGKGKSGVYFVAVEGIPEKVRIRVQTGPAINGTELRDATGTITFGQFVNQIEYQDAGSALNNEMKKLVLVDIDNKNLTGKTISVVGVFKLINPKNWFVTPVRLEVQ